MAEGAVKKRSTSGRQRKGRQLVRLKTLDALDSRTHAAIKAKALVSALESDLGGPDNVTVAERQSCSTLASWVR